MIGATPRNVGASVRARLMRRSRETGDDFHTHARQAFSGLRDPDLLNLLGRIGALVAGMAGKPLTYAEFVAPNGPGRICALSFVPA